jgi:hypothetical protein
MEEKEKGSDSMRKTLEEELKELPIELQEEVADFVHFLKERHNPKQERPLKLDWRGALKELRDQYTSVELQHESLKWWGD